nr:leucine-rich repeat extensin-like protein 3 [Aegilops tauschii subsp. strangulata]
MHRRPAKSPGTSVLARPTRFPRVPASARNCLWCALARARGHAPRCCSCFYCCTAEPRPAPPRSPYAACGPVVVASSAASPMHVVAWPCGCSAPPWPPRISAPPLHAPAAPRPPPALCLGHTRAGHARGGPHTGPLPSRARRPHHPLRQPMARCGAPPRCYPAAAHALHHPLLLPCAHARVLAAPPPTPAPSVTHRPPQTPCPSPCAARRGARPQVLHASARDQAAPARPLRPLCQ